MMPPLPMQGLFISLVGWLNRQRHLLHLRYEVWCSRRFEVYCEKIRCQNIAELEQDHRALMENEIARLKSEAKESSLSSEHHEGFNRK